MAKAPEVDIQIIHYSKDEFSEQFVHQFPEMDPFLDKQGVTWINVDGTDCKETMLYLADKLNLHDSIVREIQRDNLKPKFEELEQHLFIVAHMIEYDEKSSKMKQEQLSFILGKNLLITFQERHKPGDIFEPIRDRIKRLDSRHRKYGSDYLLYSLFEQMLDHYFLVLENIGDFTEEIENDIIFSPTPERLAQVYSIKRELISLRKSVWPLREVLNRMEKTVTPLIQKNTHRYIRESYDQTILIMETIETYRDITSSMLDIYLSSMNNKMSNIMKVLTIMSSIFIPLTFISSIYGMNFEYMPELKMKYGYYTIIGLCFTLGLGMMVYFKKKRWF